MHLLEVLYQKLKTMTTITKEIIDRIFKEPGIKYELTDFESLGKPIHDILHIYPKTVETGRDAGKTKFYLKSIVPFSSGKEEVQVHVDGGKSSPEEIVRQLFDIRKFRVWVAPESFQREIRNLYDQAAESEQRSRALLDQAKARVEQLIEEASET